MSRSIWLQDPGIHRHLEIQFFTMKRTSFYVPHVTAQIHHRHRIIRYHKVGAIVRMPSMASSMKMSDPRDRLQASSGDRLKDCCFHLLEAALPQLCRSWPLASCTQSPSGSSPTSQSDHGYHGLFLMTPDRCVAIKTWDTQSHMGTVRWIGISQVLTHPRLMLYLSHRSFMQRKPYTSGDASHF